MHLILLVGKFYAGFGLVFGLYLLWMFRDKLKSKDEASHGK